MEWTNQQAARAPEAVDAPKLRLPKWWNSAWPLACLAVGVIITIVWICLLGYVFVNGIRWLI